MGAAWPGLRNGPRKSSVQQFGKKLWPLFHVLIANGCSLAWAWQWAKKELRPAHWQKIVATFSCFDCQWIQLGLGFDTGQERAMCGNSAKSCGNFFRFRLPMDAALLGLHNGPRMSSVWHFGKKLWPLFQVLIANGCSSAWVLQRAKKELRLALWQKNSGHFFRF